MKFFSANIQSLRELYSNSLRKALSMEEQITDALPKMIGKATDTQLKQAFQSHLQETEEHVRRLRQILSEDANSTSTIKCKPLAALVTEAEETLKDAKDESVRDVALISSAQQVEHHEMAVYGALRQWAHILGRDQDAQILDQTLKEEGHADRLLTEIASRVNPYAEKAA